jgi:hypothetical protein
VGGPVSLVLRVPTCCSAERMTAVYSHAERLREDRSKRVSPWLCWRNDGAIKLMIPLAEGQRRVLVMTERFDEALVGYSDSD